MPDIAQSVQTAPEAGAKPEHDAAGRFAKGNCGGPGNPFGPRVADMRRAFLDAVTDEDMRAIAKALVKKATEGSVPAAKIVLAHVLGKPGTYIPEQWPAQPRPDQRSQEWDVMQILAREDSPHDSLLPSGPPSTNANFRGPGASKGNKPSPLPANFGNPANVSVVAGKPSPRGK